MLFRKKLIWYEIRILVPKNFFYSFRFCKTHFVFMILDKSATILRNYTNYF